MRKPIYTIIFVLATSTLVSGCIAAAAAGVAGVGAGGYYAGTTGAGREERRVEAKAMADAQRQVQEQQVAQKSADQGIASQIAMNYTSGQLVDQVAIYPQVNDGVVVLQGRAPNEAVAQNAIRIASQQPGVKRIISNIQIMQPNGGYAAQAFTPAAAVAPQLTPDQQMQQQLQQQLNGVPAPMQQPSVQQVPQQIPQQVVPQAAPQAVPQPQQMVPASQDPTRLQKQSQMRFLPAATAGAVAGQQLSQQGQAQPNQQQVVQQRQVLQQQQVPQPQQNQLRVLQQQAVAPVEQKPVQQLSVKAPAPQPLKQLPPAQVGTSAPDSAPNLNKSFNQQKKIYESSDAAGSKVINNNSTAAGVTPQKKNQQPDLAKADQKPKQAEKKKILPPPVTKEPEVSAVKNQDTSVKSEAAKNNTEATSTKNNIEDTDSDYTEYKPAVIKEPLEQVAAPEPEQQKPVAHPRTLNIPAPLITDENDVGYVEYKGTYKPAKVANIPTQRAPLRQVEIVPAAAPAPVQVQRVVQQPTVVQPVIVQQVPMVVQQPVIQQVQPVMHQPVAMPAIAAPAPSEDNDAFYEQLYRQ